MKSFVMVKKSNVMFAISSAMMFQTQNESIQIIFIVKIPNVLDIFMYKKL